MVRLISTLAISIALLLGVSALPVTDSSPADEPVNRSPNQNNFGFEDEVAERSEIIQEGAALRNKNWDKVDESIKTMAKDIDNYKALLDEYLAIMNTYEEPSNDQSK